MKIPSDIGDRLRRARELKGKRLARKKLTLTEVAEMIGQTHGNLSRIENNKYAPGKDTLISLAKLYENDFGIAELSKYVTRHNQAAEIPLVGRVVAGRPIQTFVDLDSIYVPAQMLSSREGETFAVQASGDSMKNVGIRDKDIIVLHKVSDGLPPDGTTVVARIGFGENAEYTLKSFYRQSNSSVLLMPENDDYDKIILEPNVTEVHIEGKFAGLIRFAG